MRHNMMVSSHPKSTRIPRVSGLSTGPPKIGASHILCIYCYLNISFKYILITSTHADITIFYLEEYIFNKFKSTL